MRRGRPNKSGQMPGSSQPSHLQSEWHVPSIITSNTPPSATSGSDHITAGSHNPYISPEAGFVDSFAPTIPGSNGSGSVLPDKHLVASPEPGTSKTATATAALFEELSNPGSTVKAQPTLARLAAERSGQSASTSTTGPRVQQYMQQFSELSSRPITSSQDLRRVSPGKPLGPRPALPVPNTTKPTTAREESTQTERAVSVPPLKPPKPNLVSRASQTSPTLLNEWKQKDNEAIKNKLPSRTSSLQDGGSSQAMANTTGNEASVELKEAERFPSIDDWESTGFSPPAELTTVASHSPNLSNGVSRKAVDLLDDDNEDLEGCAPTRLNSYAPNTLHPSSKHISSASATAADASPPTQIPGVSRSGDLSYVPAPPSPAVPSSSSDGEDDEGPEEPTGHHYGTSMPHTLPDSEVRSPSPSTALASRSQRSPGRAPPILAPKPKRGGISSIVSRYENISTSEPSTGNNVDRIRSNSLNKPTKPPKPNFTGPSRQGSLQVSAPTPSDSAAEDFSSRYPSLGAEEDILWPSASRRETSLANNDHTARSCPVDSSSRPSSEFREGSSRARPQSMHFQNPQTSVSNDAPLKGSHGLDKHPQIPEEADSETYQGVANLRDRWQKMQSGSGSSSQHDSKSDGLGRRATTLGTNRWERH